MKNTLYSQLEYTLTIDGLKKIFGLTDEQIQTMERTGLEIENAKFLVQFNSKKKESSDWYAQLFVTIAGATGELVQDFHYGLFILGTEKHESRRIDNQLRGRAGRQ
ncbi:hypothetical protein J5893_03340 [bacterium]|nr:hypothetical protein [bacterium]